MCECMYEHAQSLLTFVRNTGFGCLLINAAIDLSTFFNQRKASSKSSSLVNVGGTGEEVAVTAALAEAVVVFARFGGGSAVLGGALARARLATLAMLQSRQALTGAQLSE